MKQHLTDEQERMRLAGLRILARIIVRHRLEHPEHYAERSTEDLVAPPDRGRPQDHQERGEGGVPG